MHSPRSCPVALIVFNRPEYTKKVFEQIRGYRPTELFIIADGPRTEAERAVCEEVLAIVRNIDWPCQVHENISPTNIGCRKRIATGLNWFFEHVESGIILEDDCIPDASFFPFCASLLERYSNDERVMMITGDQPLRQFTSETSYFFTRYYAIWGWATWRRAWSQYNDMKEWPSLKARGALRTFFSHRGAISYFTGLFDAASLPTSNSWATRWFYTCLFNNGLCLTPAVNLVSNIGVQGVHSSPGENNNVPLASLDISTLTHPDLIHASRMYEEAFFQRNFPYLRWAKVYSYIMRHLVFIKKKIWSLF